MLPPLLGVANSVTLQHSLCDAIATAPYSNKTMGMAIAHVATTSWCCDIILVATHVMRGNTLSCNTRLLLLVYRLL